jgi:hypothetical protein
MYQWRKFEFFEEKAAGRGGGGGAPSVPAEIAGRVTCCSGGRGRVAVGCDDGTVGILDRGFRLSYGFQAYASSVLFLQQLKVHTEETHLEPCNSSHRFAVSVAHNLIPYNEGTEKNYKLFLCGNRLLIMVIGPIVRQSTGNNKPCSVALNNARHHYKVSATNLL